MTQKIGIKICQQSRNVLMLQCVVYRVAMRSRTINISSNKQCDTYGNVTTHIPPIIKLRHDITQFFLRHVHSSSKARYGASSFNFQYPPVSLRSSSSCLLHLSRLPVTYIFPTNFHQECVQKAVPPQDVSNPVSLPSFYCTQLILSILSLCNISHTIGITDLLQPTPASQFKIFRAFLMQLF